MGNSSLRDDSRLHVQIFISLLISTMVVFSMSYSVTAIVYADNLNPGIYSNNSTPFGVPYGEWMSNWWQWNMEIPAETIQGIIIVQKSAPLMKSGPVWFLPDILTGKEERTCTIPTGKAILVPLLTGEWHNDGTEPEPLTDMEMKEAAMAGDNYGVISATLDAYAIKES